MSRPGSNRDLSEAFQDFLTGCAKFVFGLGALVSLVAIGLLILTAFRVGGGDTASQVASTKEALNNVDMFAKILEIGILAVVVGSTYLFWGEELLGATQLLVAGALYFAPLYLPNLISNTSNEAVGAAFGAIQMGGTILGGIAVLVLSADILTRVRNRVKNGTKADQLKYGKGIKEEADKQNVFMGKCWQLPYCRKFVRERCPIFHAKRTCWKERVGCMCEEEVIRNAMENKPIPKDALLAANHIPRNHRLSEQQKIDRCKSCVIYNEHQRHKYKLSMPITLFGFVAIYGLFHGPLIAGTEGLTGRINQIVHKATLGATGAYTPPTFFVEMLLAVFFIIALTYAMKILEFLIFKLKV